MPTIFHYSLGDLTIDIIRTLQSRIQTPLIEIAPPQGLEPWTYGLTVRRSNQLSYGGVDMNRFKGQQIYYNKPVEPITLKLLFSTTCYSIALTVSRQSSAFAINLSYTSLA